MAVTYDQPHYLITVFGDAWTAVETWQFSVRARPASTGVITDSDCQTLANSMATPTIAMFNGTGFNASNGSRCLGIKVAHIQTDGHYPATHVPGIYTYPTPLVGSATGAGLPQATMCVTLHGTVPRGRGSRGRFFCPPFAGGVAVADGRLTAAQADAIETLAHDWLVSLNAQPMVDNVCVFSGLGAGLSSPVIGVSVGRVVDTMRSRRRSIPEGRTVRSVP
jgi:hypothetical protein